MPYSFYELSLYFFVYALLGWCCEVVFAAVSLGKFVNRGFLNGPVCPIYGFGVVLVVVLLQPLKSNILLLFLGAVVLTSALEFLTGLALEQIFRQKWWDYSGEPFQLKGYVCLKFSLLWGLACVLILDVVHPLLAGLLGLLPTAAGAVALAAAYALLLADLCVSVAAIAGLKKQHRAAAELAADIHALSDKMGQTLSEGTLAVRTRTEKQKKQLEARLDAARAVLEKKRWGQGRLLKAFPRLREGRSHKAMLALKSRLAAHRKQD